jgi:hypothetical protein
MKTVKLFGESISIYPDEEMALNEFATFCTFMDTFSDAYVNFDSAAFCCYCKRNGEDSWLELTEAEALELQNALFYHVEGK